MPRPILNIWIEFIWFKHVLFCRIGLGEAEIDDILAERDDVAITCEFCDAEYRYDAIDIAALFKGAAADDDTSTQIH